MICDDPPHPPRVHQRDYSFNCLERVQVLEKKLHLKTRRDIENILCFLYVHLLVSKNKRFQFYVKEGKTICVKKIYKCTTDDMMINEKWKIIQANLTCWSCVFWRFFYIFLFYRDDVSSLYSSTCPLTRRWYTSI